MKQIKMSVPEGITVLVIRMLHAESGTWFLKTAINPNKNPANEVMRIGRLWKRIVQYFASERCQAYEGFIQAKLLSNDLMLACCTRVPQPDKSLRVPVAPKANPPATPSPAAVMGGADTSSSKQAPAPSGTVICMRKARIRKAKKG